MKKKLLYVLLSLALCALLSGCAELVPSEYSQITRHSDPGPQAVQDNQILLATDREELVQAISAFIGAKQPHGQIRVYSYPGNLEEDLPGAVYAAAREDPYGAYVVDYITHSCKRIVSYSEVDVDITYREDVVSRDSLKYVVSSSAVRNAIQDAVDRYDDKLVLYLTYYSQIDYNLMVQTYCLRKPDRLMAVPEVHAASYPEGASPCILELRFRYPYSAEELRDQAQAVQESLDAASVYVRYRSGQQAKAELLYTYLMERFSYTASSTPTPVYSFLCQGLADPNGAAVCWQLLCDRAGLECFTVSGMRGGSEYRWNILNLDGVYRHVDICSDLLNATDLQLRTDSAMGEYYWDVTQYPACPDPAPDVPEDVFIPEDPKDDPSESDNEEAAEPAPEDEAENPNRRSQNT